MRFLIFLLLMTGVAVAADDEGQFAIEGPGGYPCSRIVETAEERSPELGVILGWALGYMTATNRELPQTYDITPWQRSEYILTQVVGFCRENPTLPFEAGLQALVGYLQPDRLVAREDVVDFGGDEFYVNVLDRARARLDDQGHDPGEASDDDALTAAIVEFQRLEGLPETGRLDQPTLGLLFR